MLTKKDKFIYAFIVVFTFVFIAIGVVQGLTPKAKALDESVERAFDNLSEHYELTGELADYPFVYWTNSNGKIGLKLFPEGTTGIRLYRQNNDSDDYFYFAPIPANNPVYTIFYLGDTAYYSNDYGAVNIDLSGLTKGEFYGSIDSSQVIFPSSISGGKTFSYTQVSLTSEITSLSNAGLLSELYEVSFVVQGVSDEKHSSLISRSLEVTPSAVVDDTGYNLIYLEVPQLGTELYHNDVVWGYYLFRPRYDTDEYYFNGLKLSFAYDPLQDTADLDSYPASSFFEASANSQSISPNGGLTVNSMSFLFGGSVHTYSNRVLNGYDYSSTDNNLYPTFMFHSIATCNRYSAGSFCYNFDDSGLMKVDEQGNASVATDDDKDDLADDGNNRNNNKKQKLGYVPRAFSGNNLTVDFGSFETPSGYDFSSLSTLLEAIFNPFVVTLMTACVVIGIIGYILYGKN